MDFSALKTRVKRQLRDYSSRTWEDDEIGDIINEGYNEFNMLTHCLKKHGQITISIDHSLYVIPSDNLIIVRTEWNGVPLNIRTTDEMDRVYETEWRETESTTLTSVIQDAEGYNKVRVYPILNDTDDIGHVMLGTDSLAYRCISNHTSASTNRPITGADYADYWEVYTSHASTWANATSYDIGNVVTGSNTKDYKCILAHTSVTSTNKPITGTSYATYWSAIAGTWATSTDYYEYNELELDYIYVPTDMSSDTDVPSIPTHYHPALVEYALSQLQQVEVQSQQSAGWSNIHWDRFMQYVRRCKREVGRGFIAGKSDMVTPRAFI